MERFRKVLHTFLFPPTAVVLISVPVAAALLLYTFLVAGDNSAIAYVSYVISAYALVIACTGIVPVIRRGRERVRQNPYVYRYLTDIPFRTVCSLHLSLAINLLYAAMNLVSGVRYRSLWFGALAIYYFLLSVMRFLLLRHVNRNAIGENRLSELRRYRLCGVVLLFMNQALTVVVMLVVKQNRGFSYPGFVIYAVSAYVFYSVITAIVNVVKYRRYSSPVLSASKGISLAAATVSVLSMETAMLAQFGGEEDAMFRQIMTGASGFVVCVFVLSMAVFMIVWSTRQMKWERNRSNDG